MAIRDPLYRSIADLIVETDRRAVAAVAGEIRQWLAGG
jgi:shikimate kinase